MSLATGPFRAAPICWLEYWACEAEVPMTMVASTATTMSIRCMGGILLWGE